MECNACKSGIQRRKRERERDGTKIEEKESVFVFVRESEKLNIIKPRRANYSQLNKQNYSKRTSEANRANICL